MYKTIWVYYCIAEVESERITQLTKLNDEQVKTKSTNNGTTSTKEYSATRKKEHNQTFKGSRGREETQGSDK